MNVVRAAISVELYKARRSRVPLITALAISLAPLMCGLFMFIFQDLERARRFGILGTKAQLTAGTADWPTYFGLLAQTVAVGGLILFAIVTAWTFGREFADKTARTLLALPTPRWAIVTGKAVVVAIWCSTLAAWVWVSGLGIGVLVGLPDTDGRAFYDGLSTFALVTGLTIALQSTTALIASVSRGYLAPLGWAIFTLFVAQILAATGWGASFPWSVPALATGIAGARNEVLEPTSFVLVAVTAIVGFGGLLLWWQKADQAG